jgi:lycopene beta-cyclase
VTSGEPFDVVIAGAGASGLSLALALVRGPMCNSRIAIIDKDDQDQTSRHWGYWSDHPTLFDSVPQRSWVQLRVIDDTRALIVPLGAYRYAFVRGEDLYAAALAELRTHPNVCVVRDVVERIEDGADGATVIARKQAVQGRWVFDSLLNQHDVARLRAHGAPRCRVLRMHFKGWDIETPQPAFDPGAATLFDFRTPQNGALRFFYVLPMARNRALVEYTVFSPAVLKQAEYEGALRAYIEGVCGLHDYAIHHEENGAVPLTDYDFPRRIGRHVMSIGAKAGRVKPSTGYSLTRVQHDAVAIARSFERHGHPFDVPLPSRWYDWLDTLLLDVLQREGGALAGVFTAMFRRNPAARIFRFLDEEAGLIEQLPLIMSLPKLVFLRAAARTLLGAG